jgi:TetR/AcrR family transcriptional regulator, tetracycline repressor protein
MTIRSLAGELGVAPMSLYRHIRNKDDLLDEVVDRLLAATWRPAAAVDDWQAWVIEAAARLRDFLVTQPAALHVYLRHPVVSPAAIERMDVMVDVLRRTGADEQTARRAYGAVHTYTIGFAALEASRARGAPVTGTPATSPGSLPRTPRPSSSWPVCATCSKESARTPEQA